MSEIKNKLFNHRNAILIIGMHRSGTSFFASILDKLKIPGGHDMMAASFDNPHGFFENNKIEALNTKYLKILRSKWDLPLIEKDKLIERSINSQFEVELNEILEVEFEETPYFYIKDPRISVLLPLWHNAFKRLNITPHYILPIRNPKNVAHSLFKRNKFNSVKSHFLYLYYLLHAERYTRLNHRLILDYSSVEQSQEVIGHKIQTFIADAIGYKINTPDIAQYYHPNTQSNDFTFTIDENNQIISLASRLFNALCSHNFGKDNHNEIDHIYSTYRSIELSVSKIVANEKVSTLVINSDNRQHTNQVYIQKVSHGENTFLLTFPVNEKISNITFYPISTSGILEFIKITVNNEPAIFEYEVNKIGQQFYLDHAYCQFNYHTDIPIEEIEIVFSVKKLNDNIKAVFGKERLELENLEKQRMIEKLGEELTKSRESHEKEIELLTMLSESEEQDLKDSLLDKLSDLESKVESFDKERDQLIHEKEKLLQSVDFYSNELSSYKEKIAQSNERINKLDVERKEWSDKLSNVSSKYEQSQSIIQSQHHEILEFKRHYADRERELNETTKSLSYRIGRIATWPIRFVFEGLRGSSRFIQVFGALFFPLLKSPQKLWSALSIENLKTLLVALRHEHPAQIVRNARKRAGLPSDLASLKHSADPHHRHSEKLKNVLYISPNLPDYDTSSGGRRATKMIELMAKSFNVYVFTLGARPEKYVSKLKEIGAVVIDDNRHEAIFEMISSLDTIIFAWYYSLHDNSNLLRHYESVQVIVDSVDVHWIREIRSIGQVDGLTVESVDRNKSIEIEAYSHADVIWAVTEEDKMAILDELPDANCMVVSNIHEIENDSFERVDEPNILFLGSYNHPPNITAVKILVEEILPEVRKSHSDATLLLAGAHVKPSIEKYKSHDGVDFLGFIPEGQLSALYKRSKIAVAPLTAGAGIKGKICEAISYTLPVMTTKIGNEGISLIHEEEGFVLKTNEMAECLNRVFNNEYDLEKMSSKAKKKLMQTIGPDRAQTKMEESIYFHVSICIVTWNNVKLLKRCIDSIIAKTNYPYYSIIVYSNGCSDGTREYLNEVSTENDKIVPILSETNDVFVIPNNRMMDHFPQSDVVMLNNDTYVTEGWLTGLRKAAYSSTEVGVAGSKVLYPNGTLQEFGSELYENGTGMNIGKHDEPEKPEYLEMRRVGYVSGCSMYIKRKTIHQIGKLDEDFHPCYCEDSEYSYRAWRANLHTVVTPDSIIYHEEGGTSGTDEDSGFKAYQKINFKKFLEKHGDQLAAINHKINRINEESN